MKEVNIEDKGEQTLGGKDYEEEMPTLSPNLLAFVSAGNEGAGIIRIRR